MSGFTNVFAAGLKDASGNLITNATVTFTPVDNQGHCISFRAGGDGEGQVISRPVSAVVSNGAFALPLADTTLTDPINVGYWVKVIDNLTGESLLGPGYGCIQPSGALWDFDAYPPALSPQALVQAGPTGPQGVQGSTGSQGPAGTVTATGVNGAFTVPGLLSVGDGVISPRNIIGTSGTQAGWGTRLTNGDFTNVNLTTNTWGPGYSLGNDGGWSGAFGEVNTLIAKTRGITQALKIDARKQADGDLAGCYIYAYSSGGLSALSDEGSTGLTVETGEYKNWFHGHVTATTGTGDTSPVLAFDSGNDWLTDGAVLLNMTTGGIGGNITSVSSQLAGAQTNLMTMSTNQGVIPLTTAWGTVSTIHNAGNTVDVYTSVTMIATLNPINGVIKPFVVGWAYMAGTSNPEWIRITSIGAVSGTSQSITFTCRCLQDNGGTIFQGGIQGQRISFDQNLLFGSGNRTSYHCFGCFDGTNLIVGSYAFGTLTNVVLPRLGSEAATVGGGFHTYLGAEIVVQKAADGLLVTIEQNPIAWAVGQLVENPNPSYIGGTGIRLVKQQYTGAEGEFGSPGFQLDMIGDGINGATPAFLINNDNPLTNYVGASAPMIAPDLFSANGQWHNLLLSYYGPTSTGSVIRWFNNAGNLADSASPDISVIQPPNANAITWSPASGLWKITALQVGTMTVPDGGSIKALGSGATSHFTNLIVDNQLDMSQGAPSSLLLRDTNGHVYRYQSVNGVLTNVATVS